jgi:hypothetical protein
MSFLGDTTAIGRVDFSHVKYKKDGNPTRPNNEWDCNYIFHH